MDFHDFFCLHIDQEDPIWRKSQAVLEELPSRRGKCGVRSLNAGLDLRHESLTVTLHEEIGAQWKGSMHARAFDDPVFQAFNEVAH